MKRHYVEITTSPGTLPVFNMSLKDLPGEKWKVVPGHRSYQFSNYGRIKSLNRTRNGRPRGPAIIRPHVIGQTETQTGKRSVAAVQAELFKEGKRTLLTLGRYIYFLFVKRFDVSDRSVFILHKDGNGLNFHFSNLVMQSRSKYASEAIRLGKRRTRFQDNVQAVSQYDGDGIFVCSYPSVKEASLQTGIPRQYIYHSAWSKKRTTRGFHWRYGEGEAKLMFSL